jgi:RNA polymerase sigma-70 factor (ECF subfamily)
VDLVTLETHSLNGACEAARDDAGWVAALRSTGSEYEVALLEVVWMVRRAVRHEISRRPGLWHELGQVRVAEIIESATDEATTAILGRLDEFEGRSRFATWVYKFGINHAYAEIRRALWRDRAVDLDDLADTPVDHTHTPAAWVEAKDLAAAVNVAVDSVLTPHQRRVALAILIDEVPIDVLAERLGTNRNALYKTIHEVRCRLRKELGARGFLETAEYGEAGR